MIATAHIQFDRNYFELHYDDWLRHRSKFRKYEIWFALTLILFGVTLALIFRHQWLLGCLFASAGVYEFVMAATHKRRWVKSLVATVRDDKSVDLAFDSEFLTSTSANGTATMRLARFTDFTAASNGFFLIPDTGISIYVPRSTIEPSASYSELVEILSSTVGSTQNQNGE